MQELLQRCVGFNKILKGTKTSTSRYGWRNNIEKGLLNIKMTENQDLEVTVLVTNVIFTTYGALTEEEAIKEGHENLDQLKAFLEDLYGELNEGTPITLVWFLAPAGRTKDEV